MLDCPVRCCILLSPAAVGKMRPRLFFGTAPIWRFRVLCKGYQFATSVAQPMDAHGAFVLRGGFQFFQVLSVGCRSPCKTSLRFGHAGNPAAWSRKNPALADFPLLLPCCVVNKADGSPHGQQAEPPEGLSNWRCPAEMRSARPRSYLPVPLLHILQLPEPAEPGG